MHCVDLQHVLEGREIPDVAGGMEHRAQLEADEAIDAPSTMRGRYDAATSCPVVRSLGIMTGVAHRDSERRLRRRCRTRRPRTRRRRWPRVRSSTAALRRLVEQVRVAGVHVDRRAPDPAPAVRATWASNASQSGVFASSIGSRIADIPVIARGRIRSSGSVIPDLDATPAPRSAGDNRREMSAG